MRRAIEPMLADSSESSYSSEDLKYVRYHGLAARDVPLRIAIPIYAEVVPRVLTHAVQEGSAVEQPPYLDEAGGLDLARLLGGFHQFIRENSEAWVNRFALSEAGRQLLQQAIFQRIVNRGGSIELEPGQGRMRTDQPTRRPARTGEQILAVECMRRHRGLDATAA